MQGARLSCLCLIPHTTRMNPCTNARPSHLMLSAWWQQRYAMGEVSYHSRSLLLRLEPYLPFHFSGPPSEVYIKCLEEVQTISCATLFAPVTRQEAVQAMSGLNCTAYASRKYQLILFPSLGLRLVGQRLAKRRTRRSYGVRALYAHFLKI